MFKQYLTQLVWTLLWSAQSIVSFNTSGYRQCGTSHRSLPVYHNVTWNQTKFKSSEYRHRIFLSRIFFPEHLPKCIPSIQTWPKTHRTIWNYNSNLIYFWHCSRMFRSWSLIDLCHFLAEKKCLQRFPPGGVDRDVLYLTATVAGLLEVDHQMVL